MDLWLNILIDISILAFVGLLYYFYQKRRIIQISKADILADLESYRLKLNEFAETQQEKHEFDLINELCEKVDDYCQTQNLQAFCKLDINEHILNAGLVEDFELICDKITDFLESH